MRVKFTLLRRRQRLCWLFVTLGLLLTTNLTLAWQTTPPTLPADQGNISWPFVTVDSAGFVHAVWLNPSGAAATVRYIRGELDATGTTVTWGTAQQIGKEGECKATLFARLAVDDLGVVHLVFGDTGGTMWYYRNPTRGAEATSWSAETIAAGVNPGETYHPNIAVDGNGTPVVVWGEGIGDGNGRIILAYRTGPNAWIPRVEITDRNYLARNPNLTIFGAGAAAKIHVTYDYQKTEKKSKFAVGYTRGTFGGAFSYGNFSSSLGYAVPDSHVERSTIAVDPATGRLFAAFVLPKSATFTDGYDLVFATSADGGVTWAANKNVIGTFWPANPSISAANDYAYLTTEQRHYTGLKYDKYLVYFEIRDPSGQVASPPGQLQISASEKSTGPSISVGARAKVALWTYESTQAIRYNVDPGGRNGGVVIPTATLIPTVTPVPPTPAPTDTLGPMSPKAYAPLIVRYRDPLLPTFTPTLTPTLRPSPTLTPTVILTPTFTPTVTPTMTLTPTMTFTPSRTPTFTPTPSQTPTPTCDPYDVYQCKGSPAPKP